jgi:hypothetical protein
LRFIPIILTEAPQRPAFVHGDVIRLVAFDFVLRIILARVMDITFVFDVLGVHPHDFASNPAGFRIPAHMGADFEPLGQPLNHGDYPPPKNGAGETPTKHRSCADVPRKLLGARFGNPAPRNLLIRLALSGRPKTGLHARQ